MKYIIDFKNNLTPEEVDSHLKSLNCTSVQKLDLSNKTYIVECLAAPTMDTNIHDHIISDDDNPIRLLGTTIINFDPKWGTNDLSGITVNISTSDKKDWWKNYVVEDPQFDKPEYQIERKGTNYVVYLMDSGCDLTHPEFTGRPVSNLFTFNGDYTDKSGHGTALASVITGKTCGISNATVKVVRIFDQDQPTKQSEMLAALNAIYNDYVSNKYTTAVVNCSWTINKNTFIESKLQILNDMGLVIVAAAGNSGIPIENVTPASMDTAVTVGSFNEDLEPCNFSNYSNSSISVTANTTNTGALDGWAPGIDIWTALPGNNYGYVGGTSISAAIHSAVVTYNMTTYDPYLAESVGKTHSTYTSTVSFYRRNMLDLRDPKYANSKNLITTARPEAKLPTMKYHTMSLAKYGDYHAIWIADPRQWKRLEVYSDLPSGLTINDLGMFTGKSPNVLTATVVKVPMKLVSLDDTEFPFEFSIVSVPTNWTYDDGTDDPDLNIQLKVGFCAGGPGACIDDPNICAGLTCTGMDSCLPEGDKTMPYAGCLPATPIRCICAA